MKYVIYQRQDRELMRVARKSLGGSEKELKKHVYTKAWDCLKRTEKTDPEMNAVWRSINNMLYQETLFDFYKRKMLFVETPALMRMFMTSRYTLEGMHLPLPYRCFMICPPVGYLYEGVQVPSAIISIGDGEKYEKEAMKDFYNLHLDKKVKEIEFVGSNEEKDGITFCVRWLSKRGIQWQGQPHLNNQMMADLLDERLTVEEVLEYWDKHHQSKDDPEGSKEASIIYRAILKVTCGLCMYVHTHPEYLVSGMPAVLIAKEDLPYDPVEIEGDRITIKEPKGLSDHTGHYKEPHRRNPHYRRFPIRKDGTRKSEEKYEVRECYIHADEYRPDPYTVLEGKESTVAASRETVE
jgi:hypothetical protein